MFAALIPRNARLPRRKQKDSRILFPTKRNQSPDSPGSFESPVILDIDLDDGRSINSSMLDPSAMQSFSSSALASVDEKDDLVLPVSPREDDFGIPPEALVADLEKSPILSLKLRPRIGGQSLSEWFSRDLLKTRDALQGGKSTSGGREDAPVVGGDVSVEVETNNGGMKQYEGSDLEAGAPSVDDTPQPVSDKERNVTDMDGLHGETKIDEVPRRSVRLLPPSPPLSPVRKLPPSPTSARVRLLPPSPPTSPTLHPPPSPMAMIRKSPPSPIRIPTHPQEANVSSLYSPDYRLYSPMSGEDTPLSGSTLARALIGNSFILSNDSRGSIYRTGLTRQDSATLGRQSVYNSPNWRERASAKTYNSDMVVTPDSRPDSIVPVRHALPFGVDLSSLGVPRTVRSARGSAMLPSPSEEKEPVSFNLEESDRSSLSTGKAVAPSSAVSESNDQGTHRISPILEASPVPSPHGSSIKDNASSISSSLSPSQPPSSSVRESQTDTPLTSASFESGPLSGRPAAPTPSSEASSPQSVPASATSGHTIDNLLNNYSRRDTKGLIYSPTTSPPRGDTFPISPSKNSFNRDSKQSLRGRIPISSSSRSRMDWSPSNLRQEHVKSKILLPIGGPRNSRGFSPAPQSEQSAHSTPHISKPSSTSSTPSPSSSRVNLTDAISHTSSGMKTHVAPLQGTLFNRARSGSMPNPITVVRDPKDHRTYNITLSPEFDDALMSEGTPLTSEGRQTFPETPNVFSPLFTPASQASPQRRVNSVSIGTIPEAPESPMSAGLPSMGFGAAGVALAQKVMLSRAASSVSRSKAHPARRVHPYSRTALTDGVASRETTKAETDLQKAGPSMEPPLSIPEATTSSSGSISRNREVFPEQPVFALDIFNQQPATSSQSTTTNDALRSGIPPRIRLPTPPSEITVQSPTQIHASPEGSPQSTVLSLPPSYDSVISNQPNAGSLGPYSGSGDSLDVSEGSARSDVTFPMANNFQDGNITRPRLPLGTPSPPSRHATTGPRMRPRLPIGPRKLSQSSASPPVTGTRDRSDSASNSNIAVTIMTGSHKLKSAAASLPKFSKPPPKWRGLTMDAAKWTFTSEQLQGIVSRAIKQSAEASSIRLLPLETLDNDVPEETHRLEMLAMDLKSRYKYESKRRWSLLSSLSADLGESSVSQHLVEDLVDVSATLDQVTEELHGVDMQMSHLQSVKDVHSRSALAMALRKLNSSFLKQVAETQMLRLRVEALEAEREEAWRQAEDIAIEFDDLHDKMRAAGYLQSSNLTRSSSTRSSRVSAMRKSCARASRAGLRSSSMRRSRSSVSSSLYRTSFSTTPGSAAKSTFSLDQAPPVPPIPRGNSGALTVEDLSTRGSMGLSTVSSPSPTSESRAMHKAQQELYEMLGIVPPDQRPALSRRRSLSGPDSERNSDAYHALSQRPLSADLSPALGVNMQSTDERAGILATLEIMSSP